MVKDAAPHGVRRNHSQTGSRWSNPGQITAVTAWSNYGGQSSNHGGQIVVKLWSNHGGQIGVKSRADSRRSNRGQITVVKSHAYSDRPFDNPVYTEHFTQRSNGGQTFGGQTHSGQTAVKHKAVKDQAHGGRTPRTPTLSVPASESSLSLSPSLPPSRFLSLSPSLSRTRPETPTRSDFLSSMAARRPGPGQRG
jgi:hypothetical protein